MSDLLLDLDRHPAYYQGQNDQFRRDFRLERLARVLRYILEDAGYTEGRRDLDGPGYGRAGFAIATITPMPSFGAADYCEITHFAPAGTDCRLWITRYAEALRAAGYHGGVGGDLWPAADGGYWATLHIPVPPAQGAA